MLFHQRQGRRAGLSVNGSPCVVRVWLHSGAIGFVLLRFAVSIMGLPSPEAGCGGQARDSWLP
jgi:hypothetical protein